MKKGSVTLLVVVLLTGCATQIQQLKMKQADSNLRDGNLKAAVAQINSAFQVKNSLYYLELGQVSRLMGAGSVSESTEAFLVTDQSERAWEEKARFNIGRSASDFGSYLLTEGLSSDYELKGYEKSLLSFNLAINHLSQNRWGDAMVEAKKMAEREKLIERLNEKRVEAIAEKAGSTRGTTTKIENINGYPVYTLNDYEVTQLKNSYQSAAAHYVAAFVYEAQKEVGLAAPGYRLAIELRPDVPMLREGLEKFEKNISKKSRVKSPDKSTDTLFIIETGFLPRIESFKINQIFNFSTGPKIVTLTFPVIHPSTENFKPSLKVDDAMLEPALVTNIDAMARRNLKDDMPGYVLRATSRAIASLVAQHAASHAAANASRDKHGNPNPLAGMLAGIVTGLALQTINVADVRYWSTLPAHIYLARTTIPNGSHAITFGTPVGTRSQSITFKGGYAVVYLRTLRNGASLLTSAELPVIEVAKIPGAPSTEAAGTAVKPDEVKKDFLKLPDFYKILDNVTDLLKGN